MGYQNKKQGKDDKYKVRLVVGGFFQTHGIGFEETFAFIAKFVSIRTLMSLGATLDLDIHQMDVKCAFLNGDLDENIYMSQLKDNEVAELLKKFCKLHKAIYGFKQAQRIWNMRIDEFLKSCSFRSLSQIKSYIMQRVESTSVFLTLYINNLLIISKELQVVNEVKGFLLHKFEMFLKKITYCLGIKIIKDQLAKSVWLGQYKLLQFGMNDCKSVFTPFDCQCQVL